jgi:hypothetical protein
MHQHALSLGFVDVWERSERAPGRPRRNGPIVRPNVDNPDVGPITLKYKVVEG